MAENIFRTSGANPEQMKPTCGHELPTTTDEPKDDYMELDTEYPFNPTISGAKTNYTRSAGEAAPGTDPILMQDYYKRNQQATKAAAEAMSHPKPKKGK